MSFQPQKILVFGGTGAIGKHIVSELILSKSFESVTIFTSPDTIKNKSEQIGSLKSEGVTVVVGDVHSEADVKNAYKSVDTVISAVGRNVLIDQIDLLKWAEETSTVKRFFPSEYGTDIEYDASSANEKPHQLKLKVRAFIRDHVRRMEYTYLVTGPFPEMYVNPTSGEMKSGGFVVKSKTATLLGDGNGRISFTTMPDVGKLVVAAMLHPEQSRNRALKVNSFTTTPNEILAEYQKQTGGEAWKVSFTSLPELEGFEKEAWENDRPFATPVTLRRIWTSGKTQYPRRDNDQIGNPPTASLKDIVADSIKFQTS